MDQGPLLISADNSPSRSAFLASKKVRKMVNGWMSSGMVNGADRLFRVVDRCL